MEGLFEFLWAVNVSQIESEQFLEDIDEWRSWPIEVKAIKNPLCVVAV